MDSQDAEIDSDNVSTTVVKAVAAASDTDVLSLNPPLSRVVDGDALDAMAGVARIEFDYHDHDVVVRTDGSVVVDGTVYGKAGGARSP